MAAVAVAAVASGAAFLQGVGDFLVIRDALVPADAVIAISGDGTGERARTAARLVRQGYGRVLILSGAGNAAHAMARVALRNGVSDERIVVDESAHSTVENARNAAVIMRARGLRRAILVTSPYHTRRAAWAFRRGFLPQGLEVRVTAAEDSFFNVQQWWSRDFDRWLVTWEYFKLVGFVLGVR